MLNDGDSYLEENDITINDSVRLALLSVFTSSLHVQFSRDSRERNVLKTSYLGCNFGPMLFEVSEVHHLSHDEAFFKVRMDLSGCLWR